MLHHKDGQDLAVGLHHTLHASRSRMYPGRQVDDGYAPAAIVEIHGYVYSQSRAEEPHQAGAPLQLCLPPVGKARQYAPHLRSKRPYEPGDLEGCRHNLAQDESYIIPVISLDDDQYSSARVSSRLVLMGKLLIYAEQGIIIMMDNLPSEVLLGSNHHLMPFGSIT